MDAIRRRLADECRGHFKGELLLDPVARALYSTDASLFEIEPLAIAVPRDEEDVQFLVRYAADQQISLVPRGAGTGLAGESLGPGLMIDLSVHFREIYEVGNDTVRVQPGVVLRNLNAELAKTGRRFAPDCASACSCTIGGMLATNASGSNVLVYGYTRDHVESLRVIWDNGDAAWLSSSAEVSNGSFGLLREDLSRTAAIVHALEPLLAANAELIRATRPRTPFSRCAYALNEVLGLTGVDLVRLLVGSEGTLGLFTEATLKTVPLPVGRSAVLFGFDTLDASLRAADLVRPLQPTACELLDQRLLTLTRGQSPETAKLVPYGSEAVLLVEFERDNLEDARSETLRIIDQIQRVQRLAIAALPAFDEPSIARLWDLRSAAVPALYALGSGPRPLAFIEDIGVPPERLSEFLAKLHAILQRFETTASYLIHAATGQVHARPFLDLASPQDAEKMWAIADQVHMLAIDMGGTVSSQHGTGIARTPWVEKQYGRLFPVFREVKGIFDPRGIFNPGKIVGLDPSRPAWPLRTMPANPATAKPGERLLLWKSDELEAQVGACNGCGACRTQEPHKRMCPTFRVTQNEAAAPRAKANLLRRILASGGDGRAIGDDDVRAVADLCINCKMCAHECPARVDVPKLMLEAKANHQAEQGLDRTDWMMARVESLTALGSNFALISNTLMSSKPVRWFAEKFFGFSRERLVPKFAPRTFLKSARRRGWTQKRRMHGSGPRVAYFIDLFPNVFDPLIAEALVAVLHHHGIEVYVPPDQKACGMPPLVQGDVELARDTVRHNLRIFAELARDGYAILCSEPTAAVMLKQDSLDLIDDADARLVAERTMESTSYLWQMRQRGELRNARDSLELSVGHHVPCHVKALNAGVHGPDLLAMIPKLKVRTLDVSCSGMAGTFGLKANSFALSMACGQPMLGEMSRPRILFGSTECGACRMQMEQGSRKRSLHPVQYLAYSYGLLPEIGRKLREPLPKPMRR